jgi:hypothetical protein
MGPEPKRTWHNTSSIFFILFRLFFVAVLQQMGCKFPSYAGTQGHQGHMEKGTQQPTKQPTNQANKQTTALLNSIQYSIR